ncbi:Alkaline phosphatase [hydrothermal vent metagenome]|uniref:Alkaline phosphatase n=1 Tax=hydrothermal vent metagenome TaxID=652676 RepID=A0A3B0WVJ0_9ZZZZ
MFHQMIILFSILFLTACGNTPAVPDAHTSRRVKNIILMIGDGMGAEHRQLARIIQHNKSAEQAMNRLLIKGEVRTSAFKGRVTDSAASATAMATGHKTRNGIIGLGPDLNHFGNIVEDAKAKGKATGLVTTTHITHATPAAFVAHTGSRKNMLEIADQISLAEVDVLMGGGEVYFLPESETGCSVQAGKRTDGKNLIKMLQSSGYSFICNENMLKALDTQFPRRVLGLFGAEGLQRPISPNLALMTDKSIELLSQYPQGFFLMIEGGQIDWASHDNDAEKLMQSLRGFDQAVKVASDFALSRDDTLIIVTADHETGGLQINRNSDGQGPFVDRMGVKFYINWATHRHTAANVPLIAAGPMSVLLEGDIDNTDIYQVMLKALQSR